MNLKKLNLKIALCGIGGALAMTALLASAHMVQPAKTEAEQVSILSNEYRVINRNCEQTCLATVQADDAQIFVEYQLDDASVEFLDIHQVVKNGKEINAYVDRYEIAKINAALTNLSAKQ